MGNIEQLAINFRKAIEKAQKNNEDGYYFKDFPFGQCGATSDMLAQYYIDNGITDVFYVNGIYYSERFEIGISHAWLQVSGKIVDITGDQFKEQPYPLAFDEPVYVGELSRFHSLFDVKKGSYHIHHGLDPSWLNYHDISRWYKAIQKNL